MRGALLQRCSRCRAWLARSLADAPAQVVQGINILKSGSDPALAPDSEYPAWVTDLARPPPKLTELRRAWAAEPAYDDNDLDAIDGINGELLGKLVHFESRARIRERNQTAGTFGG